LAHRYLFCLSFRFLHLFFLCSCHLQTESLLVDALRTSRAQAQADARTRPVGGVLHWPARAAARELLAGMLMAGRENECVRLARLDPQLAVDLITQMAAAGREREARMLTEVPFLISSLYLCLGSEH
jgi:hypothetical protein